MLNFLWIKPMNHHSTTRKPHDRRPAQDEGELHLVEWPAFPLRSSSLNKAWIASLPQVPQCSDQRIHFLACVVKRQ